MNTTTGIRKICVSSKITTMKEPAMFSRFDNQSSGPVNMIWPRHRTTFSPALQHPAQKAGHCFLINSAKDIRRSFLWDSSKDTGFPNNNIQRFMEERVWEGKTHCTFLLFVCFLLFCFLWYTQVPLKRLLRVCLLSLPAREWYHSYKYSSIPRSTYT